MDKTTGVTIGVIVVLLIGFGIYFMNRGPEAAEDVNVNATTSNSDNQNTTATTGRVVFSVTDAAVNMGTISEVNMKVNSVQLHNSTTGWTNFYSTPHTYSLLMLKSKKQSEILADTTVASGTYDQVRLDIDSVAIKTKAGVTKVATLPSKQFVMNTMLKVNADSTASANFDFLADKSISTTEKGEYVFAPVVKAETRSDATVSINSANVVSINGGTVDSNSTAGMDVDGTVKLNFMLNTAQKLNLDADGGVIINGSALLK